MSGTMNTSLGKGFTLNGDYWAWTDKSEVLLLKDGNWVYQFTFECDDKEAIVLLKAYIRSRHYVQ